MRTAKKFIAKGILGIFLLSAVSVSAQQQQQRARGDFKGFELTEEQKAQVKEIRLENAKATKDLKNELNELRAKKRTLMSAEKLNKTAIYSNIDKCTAINQELSKERLEMRLAMRNILTEEQRMKAGKGFKMRKGKMHAQAKKKRGHGKGQMHTRGMQQGKMHKRGDRNILDLTDAQKEQMKEMRIAHRKQSQDLRNQIEELQLKKKHLMTSENPDKNALLDNINQMSKVKNQLAKMKVDHQMEKRSILNDDQLALFLSRPHMGKRHGKYHRR
jgi:Spy/CpxP family protein refolding chaperone